jgi:hypothetical protein
VPYPSEIALSSKVRDGERHTPDADDMLPGVSIEPLIAQETVQFDRFGFGETSQPHFTLAGHGLPEIRLGGREHRRAFGPGTSLMAASLVLAVAAVSTKAFAAKIGGSRPTA